MRSVSTHANEIWPMQNKTVVVFIQQWSDWTHPKMGAALGTWSLHDKNKKMIDIPVCKSSLFVEVSSKHSPTLLVGELSAEKMKSFEDWPNHLFVYGIVILKMETYKEKEMIENHFEKLKKESCPLGSV